jgi:prevent-host-death family protein
MVMCTIVLVKQETISASEFKTHCLRLLDAVAEGRSIVVTKRGRPVARLSPVEPVRKPLRGSWTGRIRIKGDIVNFNAADEWESAE